MPIVSPSSVRARYDAQNARLLLPKLDNHGRPIVTPNGQEEEPSHPFQVLDQPAIIVAGPFVDYTLIVPPVPLDLYALDEIQLEVSPDDGETWQAVWIHGRNLKLTAQNSVIYLPIPGMYRVRRLNTGTFSDALGQYRVNGTASSSVRFGTLTHEAAMAMLPWHTRGADGAQGAQGIIPPIRIHTYPYAPIITVETQLYDIADITLEGPLVLFFTGGIDGKKTHVRLRQDATGSWPVTFSGVRFGTDLTPSYAIPSTTPGALDHLLVTYVLQDNTYDLVSYSHGFL